MHNKLKSLSDFLQEGPNSRPCCPDHIQNRLSMCSALDKSAWLIRCLGIASSFGSSGSELPEEGARRRWEFVNAPCYNAAQPRRSCHSYISQVAIAMRRHTVHENTGFCGCSCLHSERPCQWPWLVSTIGSKLRRSGQIVLQFLDCASGQRRAGRVGSKTLPGTERLWLKRRQPTSSVTVRVAVHIAAHWSCVLAVFA